MYDLNESFPVLMPRKGAAMWIPCTVLYSSGFKHTSACRDAEQHEQRLTQHRVLKSSRRELKQILLIIILEHWGLSYLRIRFSVQENNIISLIDYWDWTSRTTVIDLISPLTLEAQIKNCDCILQWHEALYTSRRNVNFHSVAPIHNFIIGFLPTWSIAKNFKEYNNLVTSTVD